MGRTAIITGISDGRILFAKLLLVKITVSSVSMTECTRFMAVSELGITVEMLDLDLQDKEIICLAKSKPDEIYNLNQSSGRQFLFSSRCCVIQGLMHCFCLRPLKKQRSIRFYQASSGNVWIIQNIATK